MKQRSSATRPAGDVTEPAFHRTIHPHGCIQNIFCSVSNMPVTVVANTSVSNAVSLSCLRFIGRRHASKLTPGADSVSRHRRYVLLQHSFRQFIAKFAVNLTDPVFRGIYHGKVKHQGLHLHHFSVIRQTNFADDLEEMKKRCQAAGVKSLIITGTSLRESKNAVRLAKEHSQYFRSLLTSRSSQTLKLYRFLCHCRVSSYS